MDHVVLYKEIFDKHIFIWIYIYKYSFVKKNVILQSQLMFATLLLRFCDVIGPLVLIYEQV